MDEASLAQWRRSSPMVYVADLDAPHLEDDDYHHLHRSLRVAVGDPVSLSDGVGRWVPARFAEHPEAMTAPIEAEPAAWPLTVAFTPTKSQKPEWIVQKLTELGVDHIVPLVTERSVVRWDAQRVEKQRQRWHRIVREAGMQSRSVRLPTFSSLTAFSQFVSDYPESFLADPAGKPATGAVRSLMIGPEGGWSEPERTSQSLVSLPGGVLRSETACVVGAAVLVGLRDQSSPSVG